MLKALSIKMFSYPFICRHFSKFHLKRELLTSGQVTEPSFFNIPGKIQSEN